MMLTSHAHYAYHIFADAIAYHDADDAAGYYADADTLTPR